MSKQDGYSPRTAVDLERRYNFGQTFAEVYGLVSDARKAAEEAKNAFEGLNQEQIFNLLTNDGKAQGIYRDDNGDVYVNASYIKSGTISGDNVKVAAATVTGELTAATIEADKISGGELDFNKVTAKNLEVTMAQVSDMNALKITASQISGGTLDFNTVTAKNLTVTSAQISGTLSASKISGGELDFNNVAAKNLRVTMLQSEGSSTWQTVTIEDGVVDFYSGSIRDMDYGTLSMNASLLTFECEDEIRFYMPNGRYFAFSNGDLSYYNANGSVISTAVFQ